MMTTTPDDDGHTRSEVHVQQEKAVRRLENIPVVLTALLILAVGIIVNLLLTNRAQRTGNEARIAAADARTAAADARAAGSDAIARALAQCLLDKGVAEAPVDSKTSQLGLSISAGARAGYIIAKCDQGPLTPPNPRVIPYLPANLRPK